MKLRYSLVLALALALVPTLGGAGDEPDANRFNPLDVFEMEWASDPRISPDGERIAYVRNFMDVMKDQRRSNIWTVAFDGGLHRPATSGPGDRHRSR